TGAIIKVVPRGCKAQACPRLAAHFPADAIIVGIVYTGRPFMTSRTTAPPMTAPIPVGTDVFIPQPVTRLEDTGLPQLYVADLAIKILYSSGYLTGFRIAELLSLPFAGVVDEILEFLKREKLVEVKG